MASLMRGIPEGLALSSHSVKSFPLLDCNHLSLMLHETAPATTMTSKAEGQPLQRHHVQQW
jgi:hypothetical protein